ncbi:nickel pincer cofactor biosynthesis protein LarC [Anaeromyxobacter diazotrophicus]|uniref:Putative nickel insertion protein n=1 Tax=Anaeromyxobacter diazotrophicus TaxID=2590199 RepID=A0A7I9VML6_9BACT|nr:nickel pincer cofactor biosynthesis protein LarC [Anaeromyxobacter diazotrophicus]GEJ57642.1 TIGR00299 family protein [Anaeromyxobacter diazotrophicus]
MAELLYVEPVGGAAGDMFLAAALDLGVPRAALEAALATLGVPGFRLEVTRAEASGIAGAHVEVVVEGPQPHHRALSDIQALVRASGLSPRAREAALGLFERIGRAEAKVHGVALEQVHFHEVGAVDSIVDVCGAAVVMDLLGWPRAVARAPELGQGFVKTAHGLLPVPPPAVLELLRGVPVQPGGPVGEAVTPTGAALLAGLCEVGVAPPPFTPARVGYGLGRKRWPDRPNVLRLTLGALTTAEGGRAGAHPPPPGDAIYQLELNLDDCPGQLVARALEAALAAGALDVWAAPCTMKKGRPGLVLGALAPAAAREAVARALLAETTSLGLRSWPVERIELARELVEVATRYGAVRVKVGRLGGELMGAHPEYEDCAARAREHGVAVKEVMADALAAWRAARGS